MSKHVVSLVYSRKAGSLLRKSVLAYMADVANHDGTGVWSSKQRIADEIEASKKGVKECIKALLADGLLTEVGKRPCANGYTIEYAINLDAVSELPLMPHNKGKEGNSTPGHPVPLTRAPSSPDGVPGCPQTVLNRPKPTSNDVVAREPEKSKSTGRARGAARATRIPDNWAPTPKDYAFATSKGLTPQEINNEADRFRDYWTAAGGAKARKRDWEATWRNWITSDFGPLARKRQAASQSRRAGGLAEQFNRFADEVANGAYGSEAGRRDDASGGDGFVIDAEPLASSW